MAQKNSCGCGKSKTTSLKSTGKSKMASRTPWRAKLEKQGCHKVVELPPEGAARWGGRTMAIPEPLDVDAEVRTVPKGKLMTVQQLRERLARKYGADIACPLTTGIFLRIAAETAEEDRALGQKSITPYWRVLKPDGKLNEKFPGGEEAQAEKLAAEGHVVEKTSAKAKPKVRDFEQRLVKA